MLTWSRTIVYGFGGVLSEESATAGTTYTQTDQVGSPTIITNTAGAVVGRSKNLPFGERFGCAGVASIRRYTVHEDQGGSAIYMQARMYLPAYGKFAQPDPAYDQWGGNPQTWNLYQYTANNPVTGLDPTGMAAKDGIMHQEMPHEWDDGAAFWSTGRGAGAVGGWGTFDWSNRKPPKKGDKSSSQTTQGGDVWSFFVWLFGGPQTNQGPNKIPAVWDPLTGEFVGQKSFYVEIVDTGQSSQTSTSIISFKDATFYVTSNAGPLIHNYLAKAKLAPVAGAYIGAYNDTNNFIFHNLPVDHLAVNLFFDALGSSPNPYAIGASVAYGAVDLYPNDGSFGLTRDTFKYFVNHPEDVIILGGQ